MKLKVLDLFCGTGGFSYGFTYFDSFEIIFGVDIKQASIDTFAANHKNALAICQDIRELRVRDIADRLGLGPSEVDVVIAGSPCQGFSSIRPYRSINEDDERNNLFEQLIIFVGFFRPTFVVFENVVGLIYHKNGKVLQGIKEAFENLGYSVSLKVLNAAHFGVPQKRERLFLLARRGSQRPQFPIPTHKYNGRSMAGDFSSTTLPLFAWELPPALTLEEAIFDLPPVASGESVEEYRESQPASEYAKERRNGTQFLTLHSSTHHTQKMLEIIRQAGTNRWALPEGLTTSGFSTCYSRLAANEPSSTITVNFVHPASNRCIHPVQDRALTPREGARLQSFDDTFLFCGSRTEIVKQIGEAVPPLLGKALAQSILEQW
jgi:DNA (cytosine-5)-methyltransferase 1